MGFLTCRDGVCCPDGVLPTPGSLRTLIPFGWFHEVLQKTFLGSRGPRRVSICHCTWWVGSESGVPHGPRALTDSSVYTSRSALYSSTILLRKCSLKSFMTDSADDDDNDNGTDGGLRTRVLTTRDPRPPH